MDPEELGEDQLVPAGPPKTAGRGGGCRSTVDTVSKYTALGMMNSSACLSGRAELASYTEGGSRSTLATVHDEVMVKTA